MRKFKIICLLLVLVSPAALLNAQSVDSLAVQYFTLGKTAVSKNDLESAKDLFKKSVREKDNGPAEYELAKVYMADTSHSMWNIARDHIKNAVKLNPRNITYRLFYASLSLKLAQEFRSTELISERDAKAQYEKILEYDSTNTLALAGLGEVKANEFLEYHNSTIKHSNTFNLLGNIGDVQKKIIEDQKLGKAIKQRKYNLDNITLTNLNKFAEDDFKLAEKSLIKSINCDPNNPKPYHTLCKIYEENGQPDKGIPFLSQLVKLLPDDKDGHLELGLLYYRSNNPDSAYAEFAKAISLMSKSEREDFTFNSVKVLIGPFLKGEMGNISVSKLKKIIDVFWIARDPLNITPYNERLLEHYSRVAYSNLNFSLPSLNIKGWQTDRGTTVIRYGIPPIKFRFRPDVDLSPGDNYKATAKTDVWIYSDKIFSFTLDKAKKGIFKYATLRDNQLNSKEAYFDTQLFAADLLADQKEVYKPEFAGPSFELPYNILQFKDSKVDRLTDVYASYAVKRDNSQSRESKYKYEHKTGLYFFDRYFNKTANNEKTIEFLNANNNVIIPDSGDFIVNSVEMLALPDSGNISFEILRTADKGVAAYHGPYEIKNFKNSSLTLSDILLASDINTNSDREGTIRRKDISILPNPTGIFSKGQDLYIYYEVYNLSLIGRGTTDFSQNIILQKKEDKGLLSKIFSPVLKTVGINNEQKQVSLTSNYKTEDRNSQVYLQLDMTGYEPGDYVLTIKLKDNITGKETEQSTELTWK